MRFGECIRGCGRTCSTRRQNLWRAQSLSQLILRGDQVAGSLGRGRVACEHAPGDQAHEKGAPGGCMGAFERSRTLLPCRLEREMIKLLRDAWLRGAR
jgi:hypothetical protein